MPAMPKMTAAQRKALAAKVAKDRDAKMTGDQLREKYGDWLTGPERRKLLREHGHDALIAKSYDRDEARAKREALLAKMTAEAAKPAAKQTKPATASTRKPRASKPAASKAKAAPAAPAKPAAEAEVSA
jgi:hypothetical protein